MLTVCDPLNIATSIFGTNLNQLNGSGQNLWVFLTTAIAILVLTGGSWFCLEQISSYRTWRQEANLEKAQTQYSIAVRLAMLFLLYKRGRMS